MSRALPAVSQANIADLSQAQADALAVLNNLQVGRPLDPGLVERVRHRAERLTADIERARGLVDDETFQSLLDDET